MGITKHFIVFVLLSASVAAAQDAASLARTATELAFAGRLKEATETLQQVLTIREQAQPVDTRALAYSLNDLGVVYKLQDREEDAGRLYQRALVILRDEARGGARNPLLAVVLHNLGKLRTDQGRHKEAER